MFNLKTNATNQTQLDELIAKVQTQMTATKPEAPEFATLADQLTKLYKLKENETSKKRVSPDTLALIAGNLAGLLLIVSYERVHVIGTKALSLVVKAVR